MQKLEKAMESGTALAIYNKNVILMGYIPVAAHAIFFKPKTELPEEIQQAPHTLEVESTIEKAWKACGLGGQFCFGEFIEGKFEIPKVQQPIMIRELPENERLDFLPHIATENLIIFFESMVYDYARHMCEDYNGGFWEYIQTSNGGAYMRPSSEESKKWQVMVPGNYFNGELSADAFGIVATMAALNHCSFKAYDAKNEDYLTHFNNEQYRLRVLIGMHPEAQQITAALD